LTAELNRQQTLQVGATQLYWCCNSCIVLTVYDKLALVGLNDTEIIEVKQRSDGIYCVTEDDGLRVFTAEHTYFLEIV
jgi:Vps16, N-terminal region